MILTCDVVWGYMILDDIVCVEGYDLNMWHVCRGVWPQMWYLWGMVLTYNIVTGIYGLNMWYCRGYMILTCGIVGNYLKTLLQANPSLMNKTG